MRREKGFAPRVSGFPSDTVRRSFWSVSKLDEYDLTVEQLIINNVNRGKGSGFLLTKAEQQKSYIETIHDRYSNMEIVELPMFPYELKGLERLKEIDIILFKNTQ